MALATARMEEQAYNLRRQRVEAMIRERLAQEAKRRGVSVQALIDEQVTSTVGLVTEQQLEPAFRANRARLKGDEAQAREQLRVAAKP